MTELSTISAAYDVGMGVIGGFGLFFLRGIRDELKELRQKMDNKADKTELKDLEAKTDGKVSKEVCDGYREKCFPSSLANHSHEGLPPESRVIGKAK